MALEGSSAGAGHWSEADYHRLFVEPGREVLVVEGTSVQGFIVGRDLGPDWEIENVVVACSEQRRGLGTRLVQELLSMVRNRGAQAVYLEVRESNRAARGLYSKLGFAEMGRRKSYYSNPEEAAVLYRKIVSTVTGKAVEGGKRL
jgi:ribosomal-protein-alanine N-acetyltransferase